VEVVGAYACSHAGLVVSRSSHATEAQRDAVFGAFRQMGATIASLAPDAVIIVATDHGKIYPLSGVPQFTIGVSASAHGIGDAELPPVEVPVHQAFAQAILEGALREGIDLAFSESMQIDHSFVMPLMLGLAETSIPALGGTVPIVPIAQNCNFPPLPTLARSYEVGQKLGAAIRSGPPGRVVLVGTGGLSHWVGTEEQQLFRRRPAGTRFGQPQSPMTIEDTGPVNAVFDRAFLDVICTGGTPAFLRDYDTERLYDEAGNGAQEIRNWLLVAGAMQDRPANVLAYADVEEWLTGTAVVEFAR
jgi:2,3-dihydroxyphenylpropionate 1,2-dioxygenase